MGFLHIKKPFCRCLHEIENNLPRTQHCFMACSDQHEILAERRLKEQEPKKEPFCQCLNYRINGEGGPTMCFVDCEDHAAYLKLMTERRLEKVNTWNEFMLMAQAKGMDETLEHFTLIKKQPDGI